MVDLPSLRCDWSTTFAPNYQPVRFRTKINCDLVTRVFPRVVIYFCFYRSLRFQWLDFATLCDWSKIFTPNSQPIRCKSKINRDLVTRVFPHVVIYLCFYRSVRFHWFNFATLCDWSKVFAQNSQPIRCKTKISCDLVIRVSRAL